MRHPTPAAALSFSSTPLYISTCWFVSLSIPFPFFFVSVTTNISKLVFSNSLHNSISFPLILLIFHVPTFLSIVLFFSIFLFLLFSVNFMSIVFASACFPMLNSLSFARSFPFGLSFAVFSFLFSLVCFYFCSIAIPLHLLQFCCILL